MDKDSRYQDEPVSIKILHFLEDIWPSIYKTLNDLFFGLIGFIKETISGLWRRY